MTKGSDVLKNLKGFLKDDPESVEWLNDFLRENKPPEVQPLSMSPAKGNNKKEISSSKTWHDKYDNY